MFRKIAIGLGAVIALAVVTLPGSAKVGPADREYTVQGAAAVADPQSPVTVTPLAQPEEGNMAEPTADATGEAGSGVEVLDTSTDGATLVSADNPQVTTNPVETNPDGSAKYLPQDGGDGEHAAVAVANLLIASQSDPSWNGWIRGFREVESGTDYVVYQFESGDTTFTLRLSRGTE